VGAVGDGLDCQWAGLESEVNFSAWRTPTSCRTFATLMLSCIWPNPKVGWISAPPRRAQSNAHSAADRTLLRA